MMLPYNRIQAMTDPAIAPEERRWAELNLTPMPAKEAFAKAPWLRGKKFRDQFGNLVPAFYFRCANFDPETRECTNYHNRPDMCRGYPWYGNPPRPDAALPPDCSFYEDLIQIGTKP